MTLDVARLAKPGSAEACGRRRRIGSQIVSTARTLSERGRDDLRYAMASNDPFYAAIDVADGAATLSRIAQLDRDVHTADARPGRPKAAEPSGPSKLD